MMLSNRLGSLSLRLGLLFVSFLPFPPAMAIQVVVKHDLFYMPVEKAPLQLSPYLELYWEIDPQSLLFKNEPSGYQAKIKTDVIITDSAGKIIQEHYLLETQPVLEGKQTVSIKVLDLRRFQLHSGRYTIQLRLTDILKPDDVFEFNDSLEVAAQGKEAFFSSIQLVDTVIASSEQNIFQRNNRIQIPLSVNFIDDNRKSLHYYAELYNVSSLQTPVLIRKTFISKKQLDVPFHQLIHSDTVSHALLQIAEGKLSTATLPSGNYYLNMVLEDPSGARLAANSLFFQLMNSQPVAFQQEAGADADTAQPVYMNISKTFIAKYTAPQLRAILKMLIPIANPAERAAIAEFLRKPDETYQRFFIYNFWLNRDKENPEKLWKDYSEKIKLVNKNFGSSVLPGYETDRGVVFLKYGPPTERIVVNNEEGALPYEVWQYNVLPQQGNGLFLFYRPGFLANDFKLLHTTVNGEIRNRSWRTSLYTSGVSLRPENSRAEQYFVNF